METDPIADAEALIASGRAEQAARDLRARLAAGRGGLLARMTLVKALLESGDIPAALDEARDAALRCQLAQRRWSQAKRTLDGLRFPGPEEITLRHSCRQIGDSLHAAVTALQYQDRLSQRLGLIRAGLNRLQSLLQDRSARTYDEWLHALREVEQINRVEQRRLGPDPASEATAVEAVSNGSVELF